MEVMSICWNLPGQMKKFAKNRLKNLWNWRIILMPATVWQIFHTKRVHLFGAYAMTGNGSYVNLRKRLVKTCEITAFKWFLAVWNHCGELPFGLFFLLGLHRLVWQCYQFWSFLDYCFIFLVYRHLWGTGTAFCNGKSLYNHY